MKLFIPILFSLFLFNSYSQESKASFTDFIKKEMDSMPEGFAISVALIKDREVVHIGMLKENDQLVLKDLQDSLFEIGSITKVFTSTLLANEIVNKNIKEKKPVNKVFPFQFNDKIKISYLSLANHTSGMYRLPSNLIPFIAKIPGNPYSEYTYAILDEYLKEELQLDKSEKPKYSYSNLGAGLLAYAISNSKGKKFEDLLEETIFSRYGMTNTSFNGKTSFSGIGPNEEKTGNWQFDALKGAGGLISSTADLSRFIQAQFDSNNIELTLTRKETFTVSENLSIGLGWHIIQPNTKEQMYWHNGGTGGFTSSTVFKTSSKIGVIVLSNISPSHSKGELIDKLCFELLNLLD